MKIINFLRKFDESEREVLLNNLKRSNRLFGEECKGLDVQPYKLTKRIIPKLFAEHKYEEIIKTLFLVSDGAIDKADVVDLLSITLWVKDSLEEIAKLESELLQSEPDVDLINAGISELDILGDFVLIDGLAGDDLTKHKEILNMPYKEVFYKLLKNSIVTKVQKNYNKIISDKQKRK